MTSASDLPDQPLFTIISLCYNHAPFLDDYFKGLLNQTYRNIQLILYDDCSTDNSWEIIKSYEQRVKEAFTEVIIERGEANLGAMKAFVYASRPPRVQGEYFSILETDDYYCSPTRIEQVVDFFRAHPNIGFVHSGLVFYYQEQKLSKEILLNKANAEGWVFEQLLRQNFILTCTIACYSSLYSQYVKHGEYLERGYLMGDYPIFLELSLHTEFGYIDQPLACYRIRRGSTSRPNDPRKQFQFEQSGYQILLDFIMQYMVMPAFGTLPRARKARVFSKYGTCHMLLGDSQSARKWYFQALLFAPASLRAYFLMALSLLGQNAFRRVTLLHRRLRGDTEIFHRG
jgi:glycosyltransferase involved in cell wall biosynthesis